MATCPTPNLITNLTAYTTLAAAQYKAVRLDANGVNLATTGENSLGILQNAPGAGQVCEIAIPGGGAKATSGDTITAGQLLEVGSNGVLVRAQGVAENIVAMALESAVSGDVFAVMVLFDRVANTV